MTSEQDSALVTDADRVAAENACGASNVTTCDGYHELDIDAVALAFAHHREEAVAEERARVVAWLRLMNDCLNRNNAKTSPRCDRCPGCGRNYAADEIERGEHVASGDT